MEMIMRKIMCMVAFGLALIGTGQTALAQNVHTGSAESEQSGTAPPTPRADTKGLRAEGFGWGAVHPS